MFGIGPMELMVIVVVALLIFGPQKLPELARAVGKGLAEFRRASNDLRQTLALDELQNDLRKTMNDATKPSLSRPPQAGDALPPGQAGSDGSAAKGPAPDSTGSTRPGEATDPRSAPADRAAASGDERPWKNNPGELPEGHDHDHHDPVEPEGERRPPLASADSELGNVPVGGAEPTDPRRG